VASYESEETGNTHIDHSGFGYFNLRKELIGLKGTIKRVIRERGFGFISAEDGREIFFHRSAFEGGDFDALEEGNSVEFDVEKGPKGPRALNVKTVEA
jgi:CspA family cold shock protein